MSSLGEDEMDRLLERLHALKGRTPSRTGTHQTHLEADIARQRARDRFDRAKRGSPNRGLSLGRKSKKNSDQRGDDGAHERVMKLPTRCPEVNQKSQV
jgi:hypothetical protein